MTLRFGFAAVAVLLGGSQPLAAQYFGQNRVQYQHLDFQIVATEHFDVYYHGDLREAAMDAARMAERGYSRLSRILNHEYRERQPIILFGSHSEFQQNNLIDIGDGVQGVTDPVRHRVMLPFTGSYAEFDHVLQHELVHQFQFDVFARGFVGGGVTQLLAVQPPLWFMEGMAEYLSVGPVTPLTAMWLKDAALNGSLPTIQEMNENPSIFPYRFGHGLLAYIGGRWGNDAVADLLHGVSSSGVQAGIVRALGVSMEQLSEDWHAAVQREYLPQIGQREKPHEFADPVLTRARSTGGVHVSPALSPDGEWVVYFSEGSSFFVDMYLAEVATGKIQRRLVKGAFNADFESLRFIQSGGSWSPDGTAFAFPTKRGGRDDIVIFDMPSGDTRHRIRLDVAGVSNPAWSPDGSRIVFTGLSAGVTDLYIVNVDGTNLQRLTNDRYADLQPRWSPNGDAIAFTTDRGNTADLETLTTSALSIAIYHLNGHRIELLPGMEGANTNAQWSPDGHEIAFLSDRTGTSNLFLFDLTDSTTYQLTDLYSGISSFTEVSPAISWSANDLLAFTYYENSAYNVYTLRRPARRKGAPYGAPSPTVVTATKPTNVFRVEGGVVADSGLALLDTVNLAPTRDGRFNFFRPNTRSRPPARISVRALLDSANLALPDTTTFQHRSYGAKLLLDYAVQPSVGYQRDNFGSGVYGGSAIAFSDILGNRHAFIGGQINGRLEEAQFAATYANLAHRNQWVMGVSQSPIFFFTSADFSSDPGSNNEILNQRLDRFIVRQAFFQVHRPFNRFHRLEYGVSANNVAQAHITYQTFFDPTTNIVRDREVERVSLGSSSYVQPLLALVYDNSVNYYTGPLMGRRSRLEYSPAVGDWSFHQGLMDFRRYDPIMGPFTLATRALFFGRFGGDNESFPLFLGNPDLLRGYTAGSFQRSECRIPDNVSLTACADLNQLVGSRIAVVNAELRFPIFGPLGFASLPPYFPALDGAIFFDSGVAWSDDTRLTFSRSSSDDKSAVREPLSSWGFSLRGNILGFMILRGDYTKPLSRNHFGAYWTVSIGPIF